MCDEVRSSFKFEVLEKDVEVQNTIVSPVYFAFHLTFVKFYSSNANKRYIFVFLDKFDKSRWKGNIQFMNPRHENWAAFLNCCFSQSWF